MSIAHPKITRGLSQTLSAAKITSARRPALAWLRSPLWLCLLLSFIVHVWLIYHAQGLVDGDEAQIGVQALRILHGERPVYFYGQPYMGSLVAYLVAPLFALVGPTASALRTESLCLSLLLVYLTWRMAGALADGAKLSASIRLRFQTIAALVAAFPPLYDGVVEMRVWGGYIETFVFGLWLLYSVVRLSQRWLLGTGLGEILLRWLGIGLLIGIGLWVDPLIELPLAVCILWLVVTSVVPLMTAPQSGSKRQQTLHLLVRNWLTSIVAVPAASLGFAPGLYWGYFHQWANIQYILHPGNNPNTYDPYIAAVYPTHLDRIRGVTVSYLTCELPRVLSGLTPNIPQQSASILTQLYYPHTPVIWAYDIALVIMLICMAGATISFLLSYFFKNISFIRRLLTLPLLFTIVVSGAFCLSDLTERYLVHHTCDADKTGRYASLLILVLPFLVAAVLTLLSMVGNRGKGPKAEMDRRPRTEARLPPTSEADGFPISTGARSAQDTIPMVPASHQATGIIAKVIVLATLLLYLSTQSMAYARVPQNSYFRSSFCKISLAQTAPLQDYLREQHIHYLWSDIWIGNVLMFKTATDAISTDPRVFTGQLKDRIPDYSNAIRGAKHASIAFFAYPDDQPLARLQTLDAAHIKYQTARFRVDQGVDVVILTPVNYTFQPSEAATLIVGGPIC